MTHSCARLSDRIRFLLETVEHQNDLSLGKLIDVLGTQSFGLLLLILSLPSALPLPAAGYSTPFGILIVTLALQMIMGRRTPWLPKAARHKKIPQSFAKKMFASVLWFLGKTERFIKPRALVLTTGAGERIMGALIVIMGGLMILPIPLTNTLPAMMIFLTALGLIEDDGLLCLIGICCMGVAVLAYSYVVYLFIVYGKAAVVALKDWIVSLI